MKMVHRRFDKSKRQPSPKKIKLECYFSEAYQAYRHRIVVKSTGRIVHESCITLAEAAKYHGDNPALSLPPQLLGFLHQRGLTLDLVYTSWNEQEYILRRRESRYSDRGPVRGRTGWGLVSYRYRQLGRSLGSQRRACITLRCLSA